MGRAAFLVIVCLCFLSVVAPDDQVASRGESPRTMESSEVPTQRATMKITPLRSLYVGDKQLGRVRLSSPIPKGCTLTLLPQLSQKGIVDTNEILLFEGTSVSAFLITALRDGSTLLDYRVQGDCAAAFSNPRPIKLFVLPSHTGFLGSMVQIVESVRKYASLPTLMVVIAVVAPAAFMMFGPASDDNDIDSHDKRKKRGVGLYDDDESTSQLQTQRSLWASRMQRRRKQDAVLLNRDSQIYERLSAVDTGTPNENNDGIAAGGDIAGIGGDVYGGQRLACFETSSSSSSDDILHRGVVHGGARRRASASSGIDVESSATGTTDVIRSYRASPRGHRKRGAVPPRRMNM